MKLGQLTGVPVNDEVSMMLKIDWGQYKALIKEVDALPDDDPTSLDAIGELLCPYIDSIKGIEDKDENPVTEVSPEVLNTFPPQLVREVIRAITALGQQAGGGVVPPVEGSDS